MLYQYLYFLRRIRMNRNTGTKGLSPLILSVAGILLSISASVHIYYNVADQYFRTQFSSDLILYLLSLILPVITLSMLRLSKNAYALMTVGTIALFFAVLQFLVCIAVFIGRIYISAAYTQIFTVFPGHAFALLISHKFSQHSIATLMSMLGNAAFLASSVACWLVLRRETP